MIKMFEAGKQNKPQISELSKEIELTEGYLYG